MRVGIGLLMISGIILLIMSFFPSDEEKETEIMMPVVDTLKAKAKGWRERSLDL